MDAEGHTLYSRQLRRKARGLGLRQQAAAKKGKGFRVERGAVCGEAPVAGRTL